MKARKGIKTMYDKLREAIILQAHEDYIKWSIKGRTHELGTLKNELTSSFFSVYINNIDPYMIMKAWDEEVAKIKSEQVTMQQVFSQHRRSAK